MKAYVCMICKWTDERMKWMINKTTIKKCLHLLKYLLLKNDTERTDNGDDRKIFYANCIRYVHKGGKWNLVHKNSLYNKTGHHV